MLMKKEKSMLLLSMVIFGTIGLLRRYIPCSSGFLALTRAVIGAVFLLILVRMKKQKPDLTAIRKNGLLLILSGAALGFNWIFLFESYNHTSVATATVCYYLAPILVILLSPILFREKLTRRQRIGAICAMAGLIAVSGLLDTGLPGWDEWKGICFGLAAAVLYACVMILNKKLRSIGPYDKTISQLFLAAAVMLPYVLLTENPGQTGLSIQTLLLLLVAGIVHTGIAYWLYFGSMSGLKAQTVALYSYLDPILAIFLSMVILKEPMTPIAAIGAVLVLSSAFLSEK